MPLRTLPLNIVRRFRNSAPRFSLFILLPAAMLLASCGGGEPREPVEVEGGDPVRGVELIGDYACGDCHLIPGVVGADGREGPALNLWPNRALIGGAAPNRPETVIAFLQNPQSIQPGSAMPTLGVTEEEATHIAAYLFTIGGAE